MRFRRGLFEEVKLLVRRVLVWITRITERCMEWGLLGADRARGLDSGMFLCKELVDAKSFYVRKTVGIDVWGWEILWC